MTALRVGVTIFLLTPFIASGGNPDDCRKTILAQPNGSPRAASIQRGRHLIERGAVVVDMEPDLFLQLKNLVVGFIDEHLAEYVKREHYEIDIRFEIVNGKLLFHCLSVLTNSELIEVSSYGTFESSKLHSQYSPSPLFDIAYLTKAWSENLASLIRQLSSELIFKNSNGEELYPNLADFELKIIFLEKIDNEAVFSNIHFDPGELTQTLPIIGVGTPYFEDSRTLTQFDRPFYENSENRKNVKLVSTGQTLFLNGKESTLSSVPGAHGIPYAPQKLRVLLVAHYTWGKSRL